MAVESLLELIERSGIIAADQMQVLLEEFRHHPGQFDHPKKVAAKLVARKVLTGWQAEQLLNGKHRGFFLGPYRLLDLLGSGGMGTVYLAEHQMMHRRCAIKVLPPRQSKLESLAVDRFYREAQAVAALDHPNIVRAYDVNKTHIDETEVHYLVMEYIDGQDLQRMVERQGTLEYRQAAGFIRQAAEGLAHAHQRSLVHRDIKPANLIVDSQGIVKILDLGLARCFDDDASATDAADCGEGVAGTADYVAPEQTVNSQSVDARADIYSLGHTLYFLLTGRPPFPSGTLPERLYAHQKKSPEPIIDTRRDAPPGLLAIFEKMTAKRPDSRYPSAKHVVDALDDWLGEPSDEDSPWVSAARGTGSSVLSPHRSDAPTHTLRASSEDTELELAPLEDEEPLRTEQAADAASNSSNSGSAPAKAPVGSHHPQSSPPGSLPREDAKAESGAPVLEDLPDLEPLENDLVTALEEDGLMSDLMAGESGAALGGQGLLGSPTPRRRTQGFTLASLLEQPVFWVAVAASLVVVLIVAIVLATISTEEAQRSSEDASQQTTSPTSARSAERVQPSTAENANPPSNVPPPPPPPPPPAGNGSRKQQSEDADLPDERGDAETTNAAPSGEGPGMPASSRPDARLEIIVPVGSTWKWLHPTDGVDPATQDKDFHTTFFALEYDDSHWQQSQDSAGSQGGFGYGDPASVTFDTPAEEHRKTAYFRHRFKTDVTMKDLVVSLQFDDGVIVYLDGWEAGRDNVGSGKEAYDLFAEEVVSSKQETKVKRLELTGSLPPGEHVLTISLHNRPEGSSDLRIAEISLHGVPDVSPRP